MTLEKFAEQVLIPAALDWMEKNPERVEEMCEQAA